MSGFHFELPLTLSVVKKFCSDYQSISTTPFLNTNQPQKILLLTELISLLQNKDILFINDNDLYFYLDCFRITCRDKYGYDLIQNSFLFISNFLIAFIKRKQNIRLSDVSIRCLLNILLRSEPLIEIFLQKNCLIQIWDIITHGHDAVVIKHCIRFLYMLFATSTGNNNQAGRNISTIDDIVPILGRISNSASASNHLIGWEVALESFKLMYAIEGTYNITRNMATNKSQSCSSVIQTTCVQVIFHGYTKQIINFNI